MRIGTPPLPQVFDSLSLSVSEVGMRGRDVSGGGGGVAAAAAATAVGGAAGEDGGQERGAPAGLGGAGPGAAEELSPSVWWKRTTVSGEEKPLHTLGSPGEGRKESRGLGGSSHSWCSSQGSALLPGMRGSHSRPPPLEQPLSFPFFISLVLHLQAVCFGSSPDSKTQSSFSRSFSRLFTIPEGTLIFFSL